MTIISDGGNGTADPSSVRPISRFDEHRDNLRPVRPAFRLYRMREDKKWRRAHEVEDALHRREVVELKGRLSAIEDALRSLAIRHIRKNLMGNERSLFGVGWAPGVTMPSKWRKSKSKPIKSRMMKAMTAGTDTVKDIIGGTPTEVMSKIGIAAVVALWQNFQVMGAAVLGFFIPLAVDALFGAILARRGDAFDAKKFFVGPLIKIALTVAMFLCTTIVDTMLPQAA